jgi:hypothetical protein
MVAEIEEHVLELLGLAILHQGDQGGKILRDVHNILSSQARREGSLGRVDHFDG